MEPSCIESGMDMYQKYDFSKSYEFCFSVVFVGDVLRQVGEGVSETKKPSY